jgi:aerobic carbon-monoxide dehydrogenase medium subunit
MISFDYFAPVSLKEALTILEKQKENAKVLAGGTDLIIQMKDGRARPGFIVDVKGVPELNRLEWKEGKALHIGAAVPLNRIAAFAPVKSKYGMLGTACSLIGSLQLRNRATAGGNICNAAPSADSAPPLLCLGARAIIAKKGLGKRAVAMEEFFKGPGKTCLESDDLLVEIEVPKPPAGSTGSYIRHTPRNEMDIAVVGVAAFLVLGKNKLCKAVKIALGAVAPTPVRVPEAEAILAGNIITEELLEKAAAAAAEAASPISDVRGSADYRKELVRVLTLRSLKKALAQ